ncbi:MAG: hypothetical protein H6626_00850 [Pseudobdellovibrionaceae bacterium]|nr:MAG: hypothetical protein H6626_00850 [Pseudobdellovibrionaceae bacterium]
MNDSAKQSSFISSSPKWSVYFNAKGFGIAEFLIAWLVVMAATAATMTINSYRLKRLAYEKGVMTAAELRLELATILLDEASWAATIADPVNTSGAASFSCTPNLTTCLSGGAFVVKDGAGNTFFDPTDSTVNGFTVSGQACAYPSSTCVFTYDLGWNAITDNLIQIHADFDVDGSYSLPINKRRMSVIVYKYVEP